MSLDLPGWALQLPGFDAGRRWWPIVCTGGRRHAPELLAVAYARDEWPTWHVAGPHLSTSRRVDAQGQDNGPVHPRLGVREAGSVSIGPCPSCGSTERVPLVRWAGMVGALVDVDPGADGLPLWLDVTR